MSKEPRSLDVSPRGSLRRRVHFILEVDRQGDRLSRFVDIALVALIVANVVVSVLQTDPRVYERAPWFFKWFEVASIAIFSLEYVLRVWSCVEESKSERPITGRLRFIVQPMMLLDLAVLVLPVYFDLRPLRILRLLRLGRYSSKLQLFASVLKQKRDELFVGLFVAIVLLVASSTAMYHVEKDVNEAFESIPKTMWWGVATLTTVGYGDVYPITGAGKVLGAIVALLGIGIFALPAGILAGGFSEALEADRERRKALRAALTTPSEHTAHGKDPSLVLGAPPDALPATSGNAEGTCPTCGASL